MLDIRPVGLGPGLQFPHRRRLPPPSLPCWRRSPGLHGGRFFCGPNVRDLSDLVAWDELIAQACRQTHAVGLPAPVDTRPCQFETWRQASDCPPCGQGAIPPTQQRARGVRRGQPLKCQRCLHERRPPGGRATSTIAGAGRLSEGPSSWRRAAGGGGDCTNRGRLAPQVSTAPNRGVDGPIRPFCNAGAPVDGSPRPCTGR